MADAVPHFEERQEFWKPVVPAQALVKEQETDAELHDRACRQCGADFLSRSRFCHVCGLARQVGLAVPTPTSFLGWFDFEVIRGALGQTTASLVALILGLACITAAVIIGFLFTVSTVLDWQAVQIWRVEWLLAAIALFVAGLLLKRN